MLFITAVISSSDAQIFHRNAGKKAERGLFGNSLGKKEGGKIREPRKVSKAKKKQEKNQAKLKKDSQRAVEKTRRKTYDIQTAEVQERMTKNKKEAKEREKAKKKADRVNSRKGRKKYD